jgi:hypothetical protein
MEITPWIGSRNSGVVDLRQSVAYYFTNLRLYMKVKDRARLVVLLYGDGRGLGQGEF